LTEEPDAGIPHVRIRGSLGGGSTAPRATRLDGMPMDRELRHSAPSLLSVRQVAKFLGVCSATVYRLCEQRKLPHFRVLNAIRIDPRDLKKFLARGRGWGLPARPKALY